MHSTPDAIVLCGGAGLRLRTIIGAAPKPMATVADRPFLELLLRQLQRSGFRRVILAVGYQAAVIRSYFGPQAMGLDIAYSEESLPLGTGGALRKAVDLVESSSVLVMNGDSYTNVDLKSFAALHHQSNADVTVLAVAVDGRGDAGSLLIDADNMVKRFQEKGGGGEARHLNAGVYMMSRHLLFDIPTGLQVSLERELFPKWLRDGRQVRANVQEGPCLDIGTPERYRLAQDVLANMVAGTTGKVEAD